MKERSIQQLEVLQYCVANNVPFAIYSLPGEKYSVMLVSKIAEELPLEEALKSSGFVMAPFNVADGKIVFLDQDWIINDNIEMSVFADIKSKATPGEPIETKDFFADYSSYANQFEVLKRAIAEGKVSKAILSRIKKDVSFDKSSAHLFYAELEKAYPQAYTFMIYTPQSGLWAGASPELLIDIVNNKATTVSLAGTRKVNTESDSWGNKELDEQQIVSDFVGDILQRNGISDFKKDGPHTINAGKMVHLKTEYQFQIDQLKCSKAEFVNQLHPTPAVCGLPKEKAMQVILHTEKHSRGFYSGFLGSVSPDNLKLFVNIRSLKFVSNYAQLYLGGGITEGSGVEMEWKETELKAQTMQSVIEKIKS